jgi:hypothetical protein
LFWRNVVKDTEYKIKYVKNQLLESEAYKLQRQLIEHYGLENLTNITIKKNIKEVIEIDSQRSLTIINLVNNLDLEGDDIDINSITNKNYIYKLIEEYSFLEITNTIESYTGNYNKQKLFYNLKGILFVNKNFTEKTKKIRHLYFKMRNLNFSIGKIYEFQNYLNKLTEINIDKLLSLLDNAEFEDANDFFEYVEKLL